MTDATQEAARGFNIESKKDHAIKDVKKVGELMHHVYFVKADISASNAVKNMVEQNLGCVIVDLEKKGSPSERYGILTERDILVKAVARGLDLEKVTAGELMTNPIKVLDYNDRVRTASWLFNSHKIRRLPIVDGNQIVGLVSARDVGKFLIFMLEKIMRGIPEDDPMYKNVNPSFREVMHYAKIIPRAYDIINTAKILRDNAIGSCFVENLDTGPMEERFGIITERDILKLIAMGRNPKDAFLIELVSPGLEYVMDVDDRISKAHEAVNVHNIRRIPVKEGDKLVGILTTRDIAKYYIFAFNVILEKLEDIGPDHAMGYENQMW